jgi:hypothetical protein
MRKTAKANDFLAKMNLPEALAETRAVQVQVDTPKASPTKKVSGSSREGLKHIGAYLDRKAVEKIALLRARLALDNSQLMKLAVERLYAAEAAKRKFGDA